VLQILIEKTACKPMTLMKSYYSPRYDFM